MADLSINLPLPNAKTSVQKTLWYVYACVGFLSGWFVVYVRFAHICPRFSLNGFELMTLTGLVSGVDPHFLFRLMHNLTHPILLVAYVTILIYLTVKIVSTPPKTKFAEFLHEGTAVVILALICAYMASLFLPVGDMVSIIGKPSAP
jgi:hypothetical protein